MGQYVARQRAILVIHRPTVFMTTIHSSWSPHFLESNRLLRFLRADCAIYFLDVALLRLNEIKWSVWWVKTDLQQMQANEGENMRIAVSEADS